MIHIERMEAPRDLQSPMVQIWRQSAKEFFDKPLAMRRQERFSFEQTRTLLGLVESLQGTFHSKCAYCESKLPFPEGEIANHRPRSGALELAGAISPDHYWWLAYEWFNLYLVCAVCNRLKGNRFPVDGERAEILASESSIRKESALLFDPCVDYPEDELIFDGYGNVASESKRGQITIDTLNLNRTDLVERRNEQLKQLTSLWKHNVASLQKSLKIPDILLKNLYDPHQEFLAMRRQFLQQWCLEVIAKYPALEDGLSTFLSFRTALKHHIPRTREVLESAEPEGTTTLSAQASRSSKEVEGAIQKTVKVFQAHQVAQESYSLEDESSRRDYFRKTRLIESIEIHNFKAIQDLRLKFPLDSADKGSWLLLLGENATGKSTVLQAVALALMGDRARKKFEETRDASKFVRYGCDGGYIRVTLTGSSTPIEITFRKNSKVFKRQDRSKDRAQVLLLGYGTTRLLPRRGSMILEDAESEFSKPYNLFNPFISLTDASSWLYGLKGDFFTSAAITLKELLLLRREEDQIVKEKRTKRIQINRKVSADKTDAVYLEDLSAGYQSVLALSSDIMSVLFRLWDMSDAMRFAEGIVLVDEIDAHLHPRWKMQIVKRLRQAFPRVQFLVTSHEPLTLRGLQAGEVAVMKRDAENHISAITEDLPNPSALRIDQLLTSEYFGLNSTISPELEAKFEEYYALLALRKTNKQQQQRLTELKAELDGLRLMGSTPRERIMLEETDRFLASKAQAAPSTKQKLKAKTRKKILSIWEKLD
jgi:hypothetical protein